MPEHLKKYVNRRINPSYFTDYDKTQISGYKSLLVPQKVQKRGWDKNTADILVTNHSNADVKVGFVYKTAGNTDLTATLDVTESTLKAGVENDYEHADNVTSKLTLSGKPNETVSESGCKIGTITITVSPENYEN